jgi:uncharacterized membrane protein
MSEELKALKRIELLLEVMAKTAVSEKLAKILQEPKLKLLYENTGQLPTRELVKKTGFSAGKISGLWSQWEQEGIVVKDGKSYRRVF